MARCALVREQDPAQCNGVNGHRLGSKTERARGAYVDIQPRVLVIDADAVMFSSVANVAVEEASMRGRRPTWMVRYGSADRDIDLVLIDARGDDRSAANALSSARTFKPSVRAVVPFPDSLLQSPGEPAPG
jgi:hypothetical protein